MSLLSREIELYDFSIGIHHWRYTDAGREAIVAGQRYAPVAIVRGRIAQSSEQSRNMLELTVPLTLPLLEVCRPRPPALRIALDLMRVRVRDGLVRLAWTGVLADIDETPSLAKLRCQSLSAAVETLGLRRTWQSACPLVLYGQGPGQCNVDPAAHAIAATLSAVRGVELDAAAFATFATGTFAGGVLQWTSTLGIERRFVVAHTVDAAAGLGTLRLLTPAVLPVGATVTVLPGCDRTLGAGGCARFANTLNYGGQPTLQGLRNPFGGDPLF